MSTELPPIIERLDEEYGWVRDGEMDLCDFGDMAIETYPELRAELLRLQEERDQACMEAVSNAGARQMLRQERDALLEALKELPTHRCEGCGRWLHDAEMFSVDGSNRTAHDRVNSDGTPGYCGPVRAIVNVEGTDG